MVTDEQVRRLRKLSNTENNQEIAASKAGMDPTTARRYLGVERLPSERKQEHFHGHLEQRNLSIAYCVKLAPKPDRLARRGRRLADLTRF
jgi:hypothetical protein